MRTLAVWSHAEQWAPDSFQRWMLLSFCYYIFCCFSMLSYVDHLNISKKKELIFSVSFFMMLVLQQAHEVPVYVFFQRADLCGLFLHLVFHSCQEKTFYYLFKLKISINLDGPLLIAMLTKALRWIVSFSNRQLLSACFRQASAQGWHLNFNLCVDMPSWELCLCSGYSHWRWSGYCQWGLKIVTYWLVSWTAVRCAP